MPNSDFRVPEMEHTLPADIVPAAVGGEVQVDVHSYENGVRIGREAPYLVNEAMKAVFNQRNVSLDDPTLRRLCAAVALAAIGRLVTSPGFTVKHGNPPLAITEVDLRQPDPVPFEAQVTHINLPPPPPPA